MPNAAKDGQLTEVHTHDYISKIKNGNLSYKEEKILSLPWSETLSKRSHLAVNGTYLTAKLALINGIACHLAGNTITLTQIMAQVSVYTMIWRMLQKYNF